MMTGRQFLAVRNFWVVHLQCSIVLSNAVLNMMTIAVSARKRMPGEGLYSFTSKDLEHCGIISVNCGLLVSYSITNALKL